MNKVNMIKEIATTHMNEGVKDRAIELLMMFEPEQVIKAIETAKTDRPDSYKLTEKTAMTTVTIIIKKYM